MIYTWECNDCGERIDVTRKVKDYDVCPTNHEHGCPGGYKRIITAPKLVKVQQFEDTETGRWPI